MVIKAVVISLMLQLVVFSALGSTPSETDLLKNRIQELEAENQRLRNELDQRPPLPAETKKDSAKRSLLQDLGWDVPEPQKAHSGFIDLNYYHDTRDFQNLTINSGAKLPLDFKYYQLLTLKSGLDTIRKKRSDLTSFFTEVNLRRPVIPEDPLWGAVDWTVQYVDGTFVKDLTRFGTRVHFHKLPGTWGEIFREKLNMRYSMDFHFYETDGEGWQLETVYNKPFRDGLFYIKGFIDQNFDPEGFFIIQEHQLGIRLAGDFYFVTELRYQTNNPREDKWGVGLGGEYVIRF